MALVPTLLGTAVSVMMVGTGVAFGMEEPNFSSSGSIMNWALSLLLPIVFYGLATALLVQLAYDAKLGRPLQPGRYVAPALRAAIPIAVLMLIAGILTGIGFVLLVVPGLWLYAVFSLVAPAVVIEGAGFGGLGRSAALTKEYRWPIVGALILLGICNRYHQFPGDIYCRLACRGRHRRRDCRDGGCLFHPFCPGRRAGRYCGCPDLCQAARNQGRRQRGSDRVSLRLITWLKRCLPVVPPGA